MSKTLSALTTSDAADLYGVSPRTVAYARRAIMNGTSALTAALETGRISVRGAAWLADYAEPAVQDWVVASPHRAGVRQRLRLARYEPEVALRAARPSGSGDEIPRAVIIPVIRKIAVSAARAASRATLPPGRRPRAA